MKDETHKNFICTFHQSSGYFHSLSSLLRTLLLAGYYTLLYFFFLFCIGVQLINNAVIVSGGQQRDSAIHIHVSVLPTSLGFPGGSVGKESACNAGDPGLIPGSGRFPGEGNGNSLQYSCLKIPMDRGAWPITDHGFARVGHS